MMMGKRYDDVVGLRARKFNKVRVCGMKCDFSDIRIDRNMVPEISV